MGETLLSFSKVSLELLLMTRADCALTIILQLPVFQDRSLFVCYFYRLIR